MELEPCPFCGGEAEMVRNESIFSRQVYANYTDQSHGFRIECLGACHSMTCYWHTEEEAIKAWNTRVKDEKQT